MKFIFAKNAFFNKNMYLFLHKNNSYLFDHQMTIAFNLRKIVIFNDYFTVRDIFVQNTFCWSRRISIFFFFSYHVFDYLSLII